MPGERRAGDEAEGHVSEAGQRVEASVTGSVTGGAGAAAGAAASGTGGAARYGAVFAVVAAGIAMVNLDLFIVNVALPSIGRAFGGTDLASLSWVLNAYAIVF